MLRCDNGRKHGRCHGNSRVGKDGAAGELDALAALARLGGSEMTSTLAKLLQVPDSMTRTFAVYATKRLPAEIAIRLLANCLKAESDTPVKYAIAVCLAFIGRRDGLELLKPVLENRFEPVLPRRGLRSLWCERRRFTPTTQSPPRQLFHAFRSCIFGALLGACGRQGQPHSA